MRHFTLFRSKHHTTSYIFFRSRSPSFHVNISLSLIVHSLQSFTKIYRCLIITKCSKKWAMYSIDNNIIIYADILQITQLYIFFFSSESDRCFEYVTKLTPSPSSPKPFSHSNQLASMEFFSK